ncbi:MAG: hypothetical protein ACOYOQ_16620, partial [Microthrixaceae bacterium]
MSLWFFSRQRPADKDRQPMQGEFFSTESIETVADSLVREFIQNSLDAATDPATPVNVAFRLGTLAKRDRITGPLFDGLWDHLKSSAKQAQKPKSGNCRFLVVEDFETTGLRGDPAQMFEPVVDTTGAERRQAPNEFFYFVRAEGKSSKSSAARGSWGIGKYTYPMASEINTFFALTCRQDGEQPGGAGPLLIGQAILRHHRLNDVQYKPDGWWSHIEHDEQGDELPLPFGADDDQTAGFIEAFGISRGTRPGLSIVVPYVAPDLDEAALTDSVLRNYGVAIRLGSLVVTIGQGETSITIDSHAVAQMVEQMHGDEASADRSALTCSDAVAAEIDLANWWVEHGGRQAVELPRPEPKDQASWTGRIPESSIEALRSKLDAGER